MSETTKLQAVAWRFNTEPPKEKPWYAFCTSKPIDLGPIEVAWEPLTPLTPAQEALDQAEARVRELGAVAERELLRKLSAIDRVEELEGVVTRLSLRLERLRPVVRAAARHQRAGRVLPMPLLIALDDLTPDDREWAEGVPEEEETR